MKNAILMGLVLSSLSAFASNGGAIYSQEANKVLQKIGQGQVFKNGKALFRARTCALLRQDFSTESTERDVLVIGYTGQSNLENDLGVNPHGSYVEGKLLTEAGVFYDVATKETKSTTSQGVRYEVCYGKNVGAFASSCKDGDFQSRSDIEITSRGVIMTSEYRLDDGSMETWKSTCEIKAKN